MKQQFQESEQHIVTIQPRPVPASATQQTEPSALASMEQAGRPLSSTILQSSKQVRKWRRRKRQIIGISALMFPVSLALSLLFLLLLSCYGHLLQYLNDTMRLMLNSLFALIIVTTPASLVGVIMGVLMRPTHRNAINMLWDTQDVQAIGPLLDATEMLMPDVKERAICSLIPLLARVRAEDGVPLTAPQRDRLRRLLSTVPIDQPNYQALKAETIPKPQIESRQTEHDDRIDYQHEFAMAALAALAEIGTGLEVAIVQRLADGKGLACNDREVHEAAQRCLPILLARAEQERSSNTYLRASEQPVAHADVLLRAANAAHETAPQELLRSGSE